MDLNSGLLTSWTLALHDRSPGTVEQYRSILTMFADWLADAGRDPDLLATQKRDIEAWFTDQRSRGLAQSTMRSRWIALRSFFGWCHDEGEIPVNPMAGVKVAKAEPDPVTVLTDTQLAAVLATCRGTDLKSRRDLAILRTMAATGLRLSETAGLDVADVDLANRILDVRHAKGRRRRVARVDASTASALDRYLRRRSRHRLANLPALWIGDRGAFTRKGIAGMVTARGREAGIDGLHPHVLRHTWAHRWLANGGNEGDLQVLGGWENADVMRRYGKALQVDRALAAYDAVDPLRGV